MLPIEAKRCFKSQWGSQNRNGAGEAKQRLRSPRGAGMGPKQCPGPKGGSEETNSFINTARLCGSPRRVNGKAVPRVRVHHGYVFLTPPSSLDTIG